jgi:putative transposase
MSNYRRLYIPGGCYFFTLVTHERDPFLSHENAVIRLRESFHYCMSRRPFVIDGIVILPDHLHCLWSLPENDHDFSTRWMLIKRHFSTGMRVARNARREKPVWQRRFWEHWIRDENDWRRHPDYIHYNPVKHGYVKRPDDWEFGSFRKAVEQGLYPENWGEVVPESIKGSDYE